MISQTEITREIMGDVPTWMAIAFYMAVALACGWAAFKLIRRFSMHRRGRPRLDGHRPATQSTLINLVGYLVFHKQLLRDRYAGIAHLLLFYGFTILFIGTCLVFLEHDTPLHFFFGPFYLVASLIIDLGGVAFLVGLTMFLYRRTLGSSPRILRRPYVASLLWLLLAIGISGFVLEGARIAIDFPPFERWSIVGYSVALGLQGIGIAGERAATLHRYAWALHAVVCIVFFALLPWRFFGHLIFGPLAWALRSRAPLLALATTDLTIVNENDGAADNQSASPGATQWDQFSWVDLLQADACTTCGRCNSVCPAAAAEKPLRPREVVLGLRETMNDRDAALSNYISDDAIWSCTTCGACNHACPVGIDVYGKLIELRRGKVERGENPTSATRPFESITDEFNPFDKPNSGRLNWAAGLNLPVAKSAEPIELLYWVGCAGSFDQDGQGVSRAMVKILNHLGINYRVLGSRERCNGDPARRLGEEGLFQNLAASNLKTFQEHGVSRILTHCPHCFNTFKNEYPQLATFSFEVEHHSQFLARMIEQGRLQLKGSLAQKITYHDPCYLARGNGETAAPRKVLSALPQIESVEMPRHGCNSSCCGGGGGNLWLDVKGKDRIENQRTREAASTGADMVITGCPFCKTMLAAGRQTFENDLSGILDLAELVVLSEGL